MALPTLEKTWYHNTNWMFLIDVGAETTAARNLFLAWHYFIQDVVLSDWGGTFTIPVAGTVRYTMATPGTDIQFDGPWTQFRRGLFIAADVGRKFDVKGAPAAANNGYFTITAVDPAGTWCEYLNGSGVAQTHTGHARVLRGSWPSLPNGRGPLRVYQCNSASAGKTGGTVGDRLDRYQNLSDFASNSSGNRSTVIYENEISGSQFAHYMFFNQGGQYMSMNTYLAPNGGLVMPATISNGLGPTHPGGINNGAVLWWNNNNQTWGQASLSFINRECFMNLQFTSDGLEYNMFCMNEGAPAFGFHGRRPADVPTQVIPWSGTRDVMLWQTYNANASGIYFPYYNNLYYHWIGTAHLDHLGASTQPSGPGPHYCPLIGSCEYLSTDQVQQFNPLLKNEVLGEYNFFPIGLFSYAHLQIKGRVGRLPDWYISNLSTAMPLRMGCTYPSGGGRQWIKLYNTVMPWDGSRLKLITGD